MISNFKVKTTKRFYCWIILHFCILSKCKSTEKHLIWVTGCWDGGGVQWATPVLGSTEIRENYFHQRKSEVQSQIERRKSRWSIQTEQQNLNIIKFEINFFSKCFKLLGWFSALWALAPHTKQPPHPVHVKFVSFFIHVWLNYLEFYSFGWLAACLGCFSHWGPRGDVVWTAFMLRRRIYGFMACRRLAFD